MTQTSANVRVRGEKDRHVRGDHRHVTVGRLITLMTPTSTTGRHAKTTRKPATSHPLNDDVEPDHSGLSFS